MWGAHTQNGSTRCPGFTPRFLWLEPQGCPTELSYYPTSHDRPFLTFLILSHGDRHFSLWSTASILVLWCSLTASPCTEWCCVRALIVSHCITLRCISLHSNAFHCIPMRSFASHCNIYQGLTTQYHQLAFGSAMLGGRSLFNSPFILQ